MVDLKKTPRRPRPSHAALAAALDVLGEHVGGMGFNLKRGGKPLSGAALVELAIQLSEVAELIRVEGRGDGEGGEVGNG